MTADYPYTRIAGELRTQILSGALGPGAPIPSEAELSASYEASRSTVRRALAVLRHEGLIVTHQGGRTIVRPKPAVRIRVTGSNYRRHRALGLPGFNAQVLEQGGSPRQDITEVGRGDAPPDVAHRLDVDDGSPVVVRRRVFFIDGVPVALTDSYYPVELVGGTAIERPERIRGGVHALIESDAIGRHIARSEDDVTARMPTPDEARELQLSPGQPVFRILRTVYDDERRPVEVQDTLACADRHRLRYEVDMT